MSEDDGSFYLSTAGLRTAFSAEVSPDRNAQTSVKRYWCSTFGSGSCNSETTDGESKTWPKLQ